ncbi:MAG: U32 family peptidase [bacterium]|nr:U32 family peptidase [bacterium]MDT8396612.1 peptidase U32 family protein [bacterium]
MNYSIKSPHILAPINSVEEVVPLLEAGARWLYGGVIPSRWQERYPSTVLLNQRTFPGAQFSSLGEFENAVRLTQKGGGRFALTLNAPFYMDEQLPAVLDLVRWARDIRVDAVIAADPGLMKALARDNIEVPLHLSTMGLASNAHAVRMYSRLGVSRIILPRFLTAEQILEMIESVPDLEYEAFVLVGKCPNIEGVCSFVHDSPDRRWPCEWKWELEDENGSAPPARVSGHYADLAQSDRRDGCGLCAVPFLAAAGVAAFKVVGRGTPLTRKLQLVSTLDRVLASMPPLPASGLSAPELSGTPGWREWVTRCREEYRAIFGHPCTPHNCYYPKICGTW